MVPVQIVFLVTVGMTLASGFGAAAIVLLGDTWRNAGQRAVAEKFAQIAMIGVAAITALLALPMR